MSERCGAQTSVHQAPFGLRGLAGDNKCLSLNHKFSSPNLLPKAHRAAVGRRGSKTALSRARISILEYQNGVALERRDLRRRNSFLRVPLSQWLGRKPAPTDPVPSIELPAAPRSSARHRCTTPFGPDGGREAQRPPQASAMSRLRGRLRSRSICVKTLAGSVSSGTPSYALVEGMNKKVIVKINDVGPLTPGRVIDFNERTMRHFDPTLQRGLIRNVKVTPLPGKDWTVGPVTNGSV